MSQLKRPHWIALILTAGLIVLLLIAPHHSGKFGSAETGQEPPNVENRIDSALILINGSQPMQGILMLRQIAEENPGNFRAQYHLGRFSAETGQWEKVIERFEQLKQIDPSFAESDYWLGRAHMELGQAEKARIHLEAFLSNDQNSEQLRNEAETMLNQIINSNAER